MGCPSDHDRLRKSDSQPGILRLEELETPKAKIKNLWFDPDTKIPVSSQEGDGRAAWQEARQDRDQAHGHKWFWAEFWTRTCFLISLAGGGLLVAVMNEDPILRTGGMSVFYGVAGTVIQREASQRKQG
ncbi:MAG: hypothetical protein OXF25_00010 [Cyanobacteria bacterium MAG CAR3_bin_5]|nr:hypothetical protein [Cyanobacteria bacterium MAG CAR3_bin_5]